METIKTLDDKINAMFREKDALTARGDAGVFIEGVGWSGVTPRYTALLKELQAATRARLEACGLGAVAL